MAGMTIFGPRIYRCFTTICCLGLVLVASSSLMAQENEADTDPVDVDSIENSLLEPFPEEDLESRIASELARLKRLQIPQRKAKALEIIEKYPDSRAAKIVRRFLKELEMYEQATVAERKTAEARKAIVREYWRTRSVAGWYGPNEIQLPVVRIINEADQAALFQFRAYGMEWSRPLFLDAGATKEFNYPIVLRRLTEEGEVVYSLSTNQNYVFRQSELDASPRLYTLPAQ